MYINDNCYISQILDFMLYADDIDVFQHENVNTLCSIISNELDNLSSWQAMTNCNSIFPRKNMIFSNSETMNNTEIIINRRQLEKVDSIKCLGVCIDHNLSRKNHITHIYLIFQNTGLIYKACHFLDNTA